MASILFVGNSFTARNDMAGVLRALTAVAGTSAAFEADQVIAGGASLRRHWNSGQPQARLASASYGHVVLQEQSTLPVKNAVRFHENVRLFVPAVAAHGARLWLYQTWARRDSGDAQSVLDETIRSIASEVGAGVVPVGYAWQRALEAGLDLYDRDGSHPNPAGSYLASCVFARTICGVRALDSAVGIRRGVAPAVIEPIHGIVNDLPCA